MVGRDSSGFITVGFDGVDSYWVGLACVGPSLPSLVIMGVTLLAVGLDSPGLVLQPSWFPSPSAASCPSPSPPHCPHLTCLVSLSLAPLFPPPSHPHPFRKGRSS